MRKIIREKLKFAANILLFSYFRTNKQRLVCVLLSHALRKAMGIGFTVSISSFVKVLTVNNPENNRPFRLTQHAPGNYINCFLYT
jgi:hypothetical protein